ncbi:MAG: PHP domain-containing protein [Firmicutes bacterium]|nr:PHP domain-containing protein [Bacillota bacterium]MBQ2870130.1 PHP domain-containing protein [bacterium]
MSKYIDLHVHSNNSDGYFTPTEIIELANDNSTKILSIADHDTIEGLNEFKKSIKKGLVGINGVEFSSYIVINNKKIKLHILGYGFNENNHKLEELLNEMKDKRIDAHMSVVKKVKEMVKVLPEEEIGYLNFSRYCWFDREIIKCFEEGNYSKESIDKLRVYYKANRFSYGEDYEVSVRHVIDAIHSAGGYVVFAHPMAYKLDKAEVEVITHKLISMGIDGIEIYQSDCLKKDTIWLYDIAKKHDLLTSVGSDFHRLVNTDGRFIATGINNNLCISETSLTDKLLTKKKYFRR